MELIVCFLIAMVITGGRAVNDGIHAMKGTEPPHLTKARMRAERRAQAASGSRARVEPEATAGDVARAYWGGAMADLLEHRETARARRKQVRAQREAGVEVPKQPWWQPLAALGRLLVEPVGERTNDGSGPTCPDCGRRMDTSGTCAVCVARARVADRRRPETTESPAPASSAARGPLSRPCPICHKPTDDLGRCERCDALAQEENHPVSDHADQSSVVHSDDHTYCVGDTCRTETARRNEDGLACPLGCGGRIVGYRYRGGEQETKDLLCSNCGWLRRGTPHEQTPATAPNAAANTARPLSADEKHRLEVELAGRNCDDLSCRHCFQDVSCSKCGTVIKARPWHSPPYICMDCGAKRRNGSQSNLGGNTMAAATGDVHDVESCDQQLNEVDGDLDTINGALDTIDSAVGDVRSAVERIEAFLRDKNADDTTVGGMAAVLDALGADVIKTLIDAIAAAKAGVAATRDGLAPLREAKELVGATDGSIVNGR